MMHLDLLIIARGAKVGTGYPMHVDQIQDGTISISMEPLREQEIKRVSFAIGLHDVMPVLQRQSSGFVVHDTPMLDRQVEWSYSRESCQEEIVQVSMHGELV